MAATDHLRLDYSFDGFERDTLHFAHDKESRYSHQIDEKVTDKAAAYIRQDGSHLAWVYPEFTDDMGHRYGDSELFHRAIWMMDDQVGRIWKAVQYRQKTFSEDWQVFIPTTAAVPTPAKITVASRAGSANPVMGEV